MWYVQCKDIFHIFILPRGLESKGKIVFRIHSWCASTTYIGVTERKLYVVTAVVVLIAHSLIEVLHGGKALKPTTVDGGGGRSGHGAPAVLHLPYLAPASQPFRWHDNGDALLGELHFYLWLDGQPRHFFSPPCFMSTKCLTWISHATCKINHLVNTTCSIGKATKKLS